MLWGVHSPSSRNMGGTWEEFPKVVVSVGDVEYKLYRHPHLYSNVRVDRFISEWWYRQNTSTPKPYETLTAWENSAGRIYLRAYESAKSQKEKT